MKTWKKIFIGGLGALTPIIMNLLVVDLEVLLVKLTVFAVLGYAIRVLILFYLGGITAFLHKDENNPVKIFELGIVAPALITALINAGQIDVPQRHSATANHPIGLPLFSSVVYAQSQDTTQVQDTTRIELRLRTFALPQETPIQQFWRGLLGINPRRTFFVIVGSHDKLSDAMNEAKRLTKKTDQFKFEVYEPFGSRTQYSIVIGGPMTRAEAIQLQRQARESKLFDSVIIWNMSQ
ncbi:MAG: SPOR domain-containing protein [candidate division KSB1 bacterium]|nr:SPOR domain-containing protein [candidate division KSB1 bacterium]MDZ7333696.1 SPOR domain-containing protein [candidate division KSB1 bacterium]MDZ7356144.1 SPOR domain-containing protein [candidate division KSB1 bacterium]MDZ7398878.1 SPOR domain-containing protein [candidate division KSB1 bacterium]